MKHESAWDKQLTHWRHIERSHRYLEVKERTEAPSNVTPAKVEARSLVCWKLCHTSLSQIGKKMNTLDLSISIYLYQFITKIEGHYEWSRGFWGQELQHQAIFPAQKDDGWPKKHEFPIYETWPFCYMRSWARILCPFGLPTVTWQWDLCVWCLKLHEVILM